MMATMMTDVMDLCFRLQHSPAYKRDWASATARWTRVMRRKGIVMDYRDTPQLAPSHCGQPMKCCKTVPYTANRERLINGQRVCDYYAYYRCKICKVHTAKPLENRP